MKFKDKDGEVFDKITDLLDDYCENVAKGDCDSCPVDGIKHGISSCEEFCELFPCDAVGLMEGEVVT